MNKFKKIPFIMLLSLLTLLFACENKNGWYGDYYYDDNKKVKNEWRQYGDDWYYCGPKGEILKNRWINDEYYVDENGKMLINTFTPDGYFVGLDGKYIEMSPLQKLILETPAVNQYPNSLTVDSMATIKFGNYFINNNVNKEPIEWLILDNDAINRKVLLLSKYILDGKKMHNNSKNVEWATSDLRRWLNNDFIKLAFSNEERAVIVKAINTNEANYYNPYFGSGANTEDYVFILSEKQMRQYLESTEKRKARMTYYADKLIENNIWDSGGYCWYWTRTYGVPDTIVDNYSIRFLDVDNSGDISDSSSLDKYNRGHQDTYTCGMDADRTECGVRPAIWVKY